MAAEQEDELAKEHERRTAREEATRELLRRLEQRLAAIAPRMARSTRSRTSTLPPYANGEAAAHVREAIAIGVAAAEWASS